MHYKQVETQTELSGSMVLRIMYESNRNDETRRWRKSHNKELLNLHLSPNIIRLNTSRRIGWSGHVARIAEAH
jgi:hypothetical protein